MDPIRILHVVVSMNSGGIENMIMNLYRKIDRSKIQFDFLLHIPEESFFEKEIKELGGRIHRVKPLRLNNLIGYQKDLNKFFNKNKYKVVHSHISIWSYFVLNIAKKHEIPIRIAHSHESHDSIWEHRVHRIPLIYILKKFINKPLTHRFACGEDAGRWLFGDREFKVINNSIDVDKFKFNPELRNKLRNELDINPEIILFGHVGRFNIQKNHEFLISVFKELSNKNKNFKLILIGKGELKSKIENYVKEVDLEDTVIFLGLRSDVNELLQAIDYILMPSFFEGFPVSLIEAQACGLKIFASDKIDRKTDITGNIDFLTIENKHIWIDHILKNMNYVRKDTSKKVINANYDVKTNAEKITSFYLNVFNSEFS